MCAIVKTAGLRNRIGSFALGLCLLAPQNVLAFTYPLQGEYVREAYFLGRTTDGKKFKDFYEQYVLRSRQNLSQYSSLEAEKDYQAQPNLVVVRVLISYKLGYVGTLPPASSFKVHVSQTDAGTIEPKKLTIETICS